MSGNGQLRIAPRTLVFEALTQPYNALDAVLASLATDGNT